MHFRSEKQKKSVYFAANGIALMWLFFHLNCNVVYPALSINNTEFVALAIDMMNLAEWEFLLCEWSSFGLSAVVCLRGGERGTCLGPPLFGAPLRCYAGKFSLVLMKNLLFTHIMYYKADHKQVLCFQRGPL